MLGGMSIDLGQLYAAARHRISAVVVDADDTLGVPATPGWTVHDVIAHLRGIVEDGLAGNMDGAPGEEWTAAQVARGASKSTALLLDEWNAEAPLFESFLSSPAGATAGAAVMDVHTHEADLRNALGMPPEAQDEFLQWAMVRLLDGFANSVAAAGLAPVTVEAPAFEVFRGRLGRRTEAEVSAYDWSTDPAPYLDTWFVFGRRSESLGESVTP
jgi:uncharacterized protein (TIGR03083 family)